MLLRPLSVIDEEQARRAHEELAKDGFDFLLDLVEAEPWPTYLTRLDNARRGVDLPDGWVPSTFLVAEAEGQLVGRVSVRHELNAYLAELGGHIGYGVRPAFRRRGYATAILREALLVAHDVGVDPVLVTCDDDNTGSARVIERCGGVLEGIVPGGEGSPPKRRYWVPST